MDAPVAGRVGAIANHLILQLIVIQDGCCTYGKWRAQLQAEKERWR